MLTVVVIIWLLVWWAVFGPLAFVRGSGRKLPVRKCPACGYSGRAVGIGRFKCGSCGHHFVLGVWGRPSSSLFAALAPFFTITAIVVTALILWWAHERDHFIYLPAVLAVVLAIEVFTSLQTKRFPNVEVD
jgi:hypothetical protein